MIAGDQLLVGLVALGAAAALGWRVARALRTGDMPLYRTRLTRGEAGPGKFNLLLGVNLLAMIGLLVIAADLLLGLGLRG
jgi:hypothetical protein